MSPDHPEITAYALGEMSEAERIAFEQKLQFQPELKPEIEAISSVGRLLAEGLSDDPNRLTTEQRQNIWREISTVPSNVVVMRRDSSIWLRALVAVSASAACLAFALYLLTLVTTEEGGSKVAEKSQGDNTLQDVQISLDPVPAPDWATRIRVFETGTVSQELAVSTEVAGADVLPTPEVLPDLLENAYVKAEEQPNTDVPLKSGMASYPWVREYLDDESNLPPRDAVRIEELVNAFPYQEPRDEISGRVAVGMRLVSCPWDKNSWMLGILLRNTSSVDDVEVKARLKVKHRAVSDYRLLGFAQPDRFDKSGLKIPKVLEAGKSQFVIYQLRKRDNYEADLRSELASLSVNSRLPGRSWDTSKLTCRVEDRSWLNESADFRFAALMTAFGSALREDDIGRTNSLADVSYLADEVVRIDTHLTVPQKEAVALIHKARALTKPKKEKEKK